jgi:arylsulfatase A-like enzyme
VYHTDWDHHTGLEKGLAARCREVDRASAALVLDLKRRGLLGKTLVVWGGEFGRTPLSDGTPGQPIGRNHHIDAYSTWLAGAGIKAGQTIGTTDDIGFSTVEDPVHVHDLHATILHLMGLDHKRLTWKFQGRDFRLTDVAGQVVSKLLA